MKSIQCALLKLICINLYQIIKMSFSYVTFFKNILTVNRKKKQNITCMYNTKTVTQETNICGI